MGLFCFLNLRAQKQQFGTWADINSFKNCVSVSSNNNYVVAAFPTAITVYNVQNGEIKNYSKSSGLSGVDIVSCNFIKDNIFTIGYLNGIIDVIDLGEESLKSVADIFTASFFGDKSINNITPINQELYAATGFGVVVFSESNFLVKETYRFGDNGANIFVYDVVLHQDTLWAGTSQGLYFAEASNPVLSNYNSWTRDARLPNKDFTRLALFDNKLIAIEETSGNGNDRLLYYETGTWNVLNQAEDFTALEVANNTLYVSYFYNSVLQYNTALNIQTVVSGDGAKPNYINDITVQGGKTYLADVAQGLVELVANNTVVAINAKGSLYESPWQSKFIEGKLYTVGGGVTASFNNAFVPMQIGILTNTTWENLQSGVDTFLPTAFDAIEVEPANGKLYVATMGAGLVEVDGETSIAYTSENSIIEPRPEDANYFAISALATDTLGNLWIGNSLAEDLLKVKTPEDNWYSFNLGSGFGVRNLAYIEKIVPTSAGQKWLVKPRGAGLHVFSDNGTLSDTSDDLNKSLSEAASEGAMPSSTVYDVAEDLTGTIWVGTEKGVVAFYSPQSIFTDENVQAEQVFITQDGNVQIVLETERVNRILVDGANRKWVATQNSGIFLYSPDFKEVIANYTSENSVLFSNQVSDLTMDEENGLLYVISNKGIQTFQTDATTGKGFISDNIITYPNPAVLSKHRQIVVKGLSFNTIVKVTNATGALVKEINSNGGIAIWDLRNENNEIQGPGVYYFYAALTDGSSANVGKVLLLNNE